jgi:hypothetical protein
MDPTKTYAEECENEHSRITIALGDWRVEGGNANCVGGMDGASRNDVKDGGEYEIDQREKNVKSWSKHED